MEGMFLESDGVMHSAKLASGWARKKINSAWEAVNRRLNMLTNNGAPVDCGASTRSLKNKAFHHNRKKF